MAHFQFELKLANELEANFSHKTINILEAMCYGYSNQSIAKEYSLSVKTVEHNLSKINEYFDCNSTIYSPRLRVLSTLLSKDLLLLQSNLALPPIKGLKPRLLSTLKLCTIGLSNKYIAKILSVSNKSVEHRLGQLFDYFGIDTKHQQVENPRILLALSAIMRGNIDLNKVKKLQLLCGKSELENATNTNNFEAITALIS